MTDGHGHGIAGLFLFHHAEIITDEDKYPETVAPGRGRCNDFSVPDFIALDFHDPLS